MRRETTEQLQQLARDGTRGYVCVDRAGQIVTVLPGNHVDHVRKTAWRHQGFWRFLLPRVAGHGLGVLVLVLAATYAGLPDRLPLVILMIVVVAQRSPVLHSPATSYILAQVQQQVAWLKGRKLRLYRIPQVRT